jgi:hypothetical protein
MQKKAAATAAAALFPGMVDGRSMKPLAPVLKLQKINDAAKRSNLTDSLARGPAVTEPTIEPAMDAEPATAGCDQRGGANERGRLRQAGC